MAKTDDPVASGATLAVRYGVSTRQINLLAERDLLVRAPGGKGFLEHASTLKYMEHLRKTAAGRSGISDRRAKLIEEQTQKLRIENGIKRSAYWKATEVIREWALTFRELSAKMLAIPDRIASRLPHLTRHDLHEIDAEIRIVLQETYDAYDPVKGYTASDTPTAEPNKENDSEKE
jgi:phage terminase Nu1 subunit (DNA packaging protein)